VVADRACLALLALDNYMEMCALAGPDPYDGLSGRLLERLRRQRTRQVAVQLVKRSPLNLRPLLGVRPVRMSKTLGLVAEGLFVAPQLPGAEVRRKRLLAELIIRRGEGGWGYEFDVQTRWGFYAAGSPNIIVTAFALEALRLSPSHLEAASLPVRSWLEDEMLHDGFIRYVPRSAVLIHNANLLGARALHRVAPGHPAVAEAVDRTLERQRPDGTWPYGEQAGLEWVDGFHTAYVLLALKDLLSVHSGIVDALERGVHAYATRCFAKDGWPYYYADKPGPIDVHNIATGLQALADLKDILPDGQNLLGRALDHLLILQGAEGAFRTRPGAPAYMRWNQAHAHRALAQVTTV
jgi:hypothetical protein